MTKMDADMELTLELARVARDPSPSHQQRVFEALSAQLGLAAAPLPSMPLGSATPWWRGKALLGRWLLVGAVAGGGGFWLGAARDSAPRAEPPEVAIAVPPPAARSGEGSSPTARTEAARALASGSPDSTEPLGTSLEAQRPAGSLGSRRAASRLEARGVRHSRMRRTSEVRPAMAAADAGPQDRSFIEAVRLLQRAQRSIDSGEATLAMALLDELDARFPRDTLGEERGAARVLALCESGQTDRARQLADQLRAENPTSIYNARIARSCVSLSN